MDLIAIHLSKELKFPLQSVFHAIHMHEKCKHHKSSLVPGTLKAALSQLKDKSIN